MLIRLLLGLICCRAMFSAGPVLHLWTAERFCEIQDIYNKEEVEQIIMGTQFPDIRYVSPISREQTHPDISSLEEVLDAEAPFIMGMRLHAWLDIVREKYIPLQIYKKIDLLSDGFSATLLKCAEDEILLDRYDAGKWCYLFWDPTSEEEAFVDRKSIATWHRMIYWSLYMKPSWLLWMQSYKGAALGIPSDVLYRWGYLLPQLSKDLELEEYMEGLLAHILEKLQAK